MTSTPDADRASRNFALIGAAGYVAPRHMRAIAETGNRLVVAIDKSDSVGVIDSYFPDADFFTEFERFDRHVEMIKRERPEDRVEYVSICSPNYLHDAHVRFALRAGADAVCEKPLVLTPWNLDGLRRVEEDTGRQLRTILQLRHHPSIVELKAGHGAGGSDEIHDIDLTYITSRGRWYRYSWKGEEQKSGGVVTNIGIHFFDMLMWIFGRAERSVVHVKEDVRAAGYLELERARVRWFLSTAAEDLPNQARELGRRTHRSIRIDGEELEFSDGFTDLHTLSYREILAGRGFGIADARPSIDLVYAIRNMHALGKKGEYHPLLDG